MNGISLLQLLQSQDQKLGIVLVRQRWEGDRSELSALKPVYLPDQKKKKIEVSFIRLTVLV
jgi:hypothetical protein